MVTVAGPCYDVYSNTSKIVCKFNDVETPGAVVDGTRAQCLLPMLLKLGQIPVALSVDGGLNYNHTGIFRLVAEDKRHYIVVDDKNNETVQIVWPKSYFNTTEFDVDFMYFQSLWTPVHIGCYGSWDDFNNNINDTNAGASLVCTQWNEAQKQNPSSAQGLPHCPCTRRQARIDTRFEDEPRCSSVSPACNGFHRAAHHCIRSVSPSALGAGQQCCYDRNGTILPFENGGGTLDRAHVKGYHSSNFETIPVVSHLVEDVLPFYLCCIFSKNCEKYEEVRPADNCSKYDPSGSVVSCGFLSSPLNGNKVGNSPLAYATVAFSCNDGFRLQGSAQRTCTEEGTWTGEKATCIAVDVVTTTTTTAKMSTKTSTTPVDAVTTTTTNAKMSTKTSNTPVNGIKMATTTTKMSTKTSNIPEDEISPEGLRWSIGVILGVFAAGCVVLFIPPCVILLITRNRKKATAPTRVPSPSMCATQRRFPTRGHYYQ
ncbi:hypothetical protein LSAT2_010018 [Lamellibrachia satsuma]|nr:hypothetical protein LSAT2_010018 [Lamellibrachia satsuma]